MPIIRLMTYNVHHCVGMDGRHSVDRVAHVIRAHDPDIVALQELDVGRRRTGWIDQPARIAQILKMESRFYSTLGVAEEEFGTAVLSRWPMRQVRSALLPTLRDRRQENRGALWVAITMNGSTVNVVNTHLGLTRGERQLQAEALLGPEWLRHPECAEPRVLCGDFNMSSRNEYTCFDGICVRDHWEQVGPPPKTWPSILPFLTLDHVFISSGITVASVEAPAGFRTRLASDHLPVLARLEIPV
jgi:endonuclease/exonuclease/phosphatase family metal-dependent hydrolase